MSQPLSIFWFRRDLRLADNAGLAAALKSGKPVLPVFIFDPVILAELDPDDRRVPFIYGALLKIEAGLRAAGSSLRILYAAPAAAFAQLLSEYVVEAVYTNHDYEPYARERDAAIAKMLGEKGVAFHSFKDQVLREAAEVVKNDGQPYQVYTPFYKKWRSTITAKDFQSAGSEKLMAQLIPSGPFAWPTLEAMGFTGSSNAFDLQLPSESLIAHYHETRDLPAVAGTTRLGPHLRFGTVSIRSLAKSADKLNETFLKELCWREFFMQILWHFPHPHRAFKPAYDGIKWRYDEGEFGRWCAGQTGYPLVDAGMRELNATGFMHNRVRMVTGSFLVKHLLIDWRLGEAYFAKQLMDFDLSANNGNWQWVAGCGCDAAPYFRIFNPELQAKRFDPKEEYIRKWVPEFGTKQYPQPMVDHKKATARCIVAYKEALSKDQLKLFP